MANSNRVRKEVVRQLLGCSENRLEASTTGELKLLVGASDMRTQCFRQLLADMKHENSIRGFSLGGGNVYILG